MEKSKRALVVVHGDYWGLENANTLVKAAQAQGLEVRLVVSRKKLGPGGTYAMDKVDSLKQSELVKERDLLAMLDVVDATAYTPEQQPELLSFKALDRLTRPGTDHKELF